LNISFLHFQHKARYSPQRSVEYDEDERMKAVLQQMIADVRAAVAG